MSAANAKPPLPSAAGSEGEPAATSVNLRLSLAGTSALIKGHPWIAADAQLSYRVPPEAGVVLKVQDSQGNFLGWAVSEGPRRFPAFRLLSRLRPSDFGEAWWQGVVERALAVRRAASLTDIDGAPFRLLNAEADGTPGVVADVCAGVGLVSVSAEGSAAFLPLIEKALVDQTRLRGLWRRFKDGRGAWEPWHRAPLAPRSLARLEFSERGLPQRLDLEAPAAQGGSDDPLAWPVDRRAWREWARESCAGRRVLVLGDLAGEAAAAAQAKPERLDALKSGFINGLKKALSWRPDRMLVDVPVSSKESFGRFDAAKHSPRLLRALAESAAPDALLMLTSPHPSLAGAEAWMNAWEKAGVPATLTRLLAPGADCPELALFPEGRHRRAFVFTLTAPPPAQPA